jgi:hypothetical protein
MALKLSVLGQLWSIILNSAALTFVDKGKEIPEKTGGPAGTAKPGR